MYNITDISTPARLHGAGVTLATEYIKSLGFQILRRHWNCPHGQADIVARDQNQVVVIMVNTSRGEEVTGPLDTVTADQYRTLKEFAHHTPECLGENSDALPRPRIDLINLVIPDNPEDNATPKLRHRIG